MVRASPATVSAASGELSGLMHGRRDFVRFVNGARACRGFICLPEGPVTRLPGTRFMGKARNGAEARLIGFAFRDVDTVLLEWTAGKLRFWRNGTPVLSAGLPYEIDQPYSTAQLARLQSLQSSDRIYLTEGDLPPRTLSRFALDNWTLAETVFTGGPFAPRNIDAAREVTVNALTGAVTITASAAIFTAAHVGTLFQIFEIDTSATPYWTADVTVALGERVYYGTRAYQVAGFDGQTGRTGTAAPAVTPGAPPTVADDGQVQWTWIANGNSGPVPAWTATTLHKIGERRYLPAPADVTVEVSGFVPDATRTGQSGVNPPTHDEGLWLSEKGGPVWRALHDGNGIVRITGLTSATVVTGTVVKRLPDGLLTRPSYRWAEAAWSATRGYPAAIGAFEQRHIYGGTLSEPRTIWAGVIGGTTDFTTGANDDDGFSYTLVSPPRAVGEIRSIAAASDILYIGTAADQVVGRAADADRAFARDTARFDSVSRQGASAVPPLVIDGNPVFADPSGTRLYALSIDGQTGRFDAQNLTLLCRHILGGRVRRLLRQTRPVEIVWAVLEDGQLAGMTYVPAQQAIGFHLHDLAGGIVTDGEVMPSDDGTSQHLWLCVRRTVNGTTEHFIERMEDIFVDLDGSDRDPREAWHQFCAIRWTGAAATVIPGLSHLIGRTVTAWTEYGAVTGLTVSGAGTVTLPRAVTSAIVGLDATALQRFETLDIVTGQPDGGDDGRLRTHRASALRLHRTAGGTLELTGRKDAGPPETVAPAKPLFLRRADIDGIDLREGIVEVPGIKGWYHQLWMTLRPEPGAPLTMLARTPTVMISDD
jgi:hypothetical protein